MRQAEYNRLISNSSRIQTINSGVIAATNPEGKVITVTFNICFGSIQIVLYLLIPMISTLQNWDQGVHELSLTWQIDVAALVVIII
jgi:hypothetical protein